MPAAKRRATRSTGTAAKVAQATEAVRATAEDDKAQEAARSEAATVLANWAALLAEDEYTPRPTGGVRIDVEQSVPEPIRMFVERSYAAYAQEIEVGSRLLATDTPKYQHKTFADSTTAAEFIRLCHYYAKYRPAGRITVRASALAQEPETIRIAAMPYVPRPRS